MIIDMTDNNANDEKDFYTTINFKLGCQVCV